ncbi:MAG: alkaline phosphatase family protein [Bacteroidia bacterium]
MKLKLFAFTLTVGLTVNTFAQSIPMPDHVVIVMMENYAYDDIIGNTANAPHINALASDPSTALFTNSVALTHPSQPNYLMLYSGSNQGVTNDYISSNTPFSTCNLGASIIAAGKTFAGYSETMPSTGYLGTTSGNYARKHNPWSNWQGTGTNQVPSSVNKMYTTFPSASTYSTLPTVSYVIPDLSDDMHNPTTNSVTAISNGDTWFYNNLNSYVQWAKTNNSLLILTWDEDDNTAGTNQIVTMFVGQMVQGGQYAESVNHYRVLRTLEDMFGITTYCGASSSSTPITDCWKSTTTDIKKLDNNKKITLYPNPANNNLTIQSANDLGTISVYNTIGEVVLELKSQNKQEQIDLSGLSSGVYFIKTSLGMQKFIKE